MKIYEFRLKFHWSLFLGAQLTIYQHWFRKWLATDQATSHYLNQWWLIYWRIYTSLGLNELMTEAHWGEYKVKFNQFIPYPALALGTIRPSLTHWGRDKMATILQTSTAFTNAFPWIEMLEFLFEISLKCFTKGPTVNKPALVQVMAWHQTHNKPLSEPIV